MVVLVDEVLESFFETDLSASFRLEPVPDLELPPASSSFLCDLSSNIATSDSRLSDELGKTIGKHFLLNDADVLMAGYLSSYNRTIHKARRTNGLGVAHFSTGQDRLRKFFGYCVVPSSSSTLGASSIHDNDPSLKVPA
jgi:hypothetical protein